MYAPSSAGGSVFSKRFRLGSKNADAAAGGRGGEDLDPHQASIEHAIFGVLFTLSKENSETRIVIRWVLLKILLDGWQLFTTVIKPSQGWDMREDGKAWKVVSVLSFNWLADLGYSAYVALLYGMVALLALNIALCVWVAWCFKEQKFPVVWPIKVLRLFSSVFFQAFDVASLNLLQVGISCRLTGPTKPHLHLDLFPAYSCATMPQVVHAVVSGASLLVFILLALLTNMAEVEVNPKSRRPMALGHSGAEVSAFAIKVLMTLTDVVFGWRRVAACCYLALSVAIAYQYLRWRPHLVGWVNHLKTGVSIAIVWCSLMLVILVFQPNVPEHRLAAWQRGMTVGMLAGIAPALGGGALLSWLFLRRTFAAADRIIQQSAATSTPLQDLCIDLCADPRDVETVARCCRVWVDQHHLDKEAIAKAQAYIKAGLELFPGNAFVALVQANFMIDVLGVAQSGSRHVEAAVKLSPGIVTRFMIFVRMQQAQQKAVGSHVNGAAGSSMDLLGYVEYQRRQRMVVRLHREALQAMCTFWKALETHTVSFTSLSKALANIEASVSQAQAAYHLVLETYGNSPRLVHLYGRFLETVKNDPWGAGEYYAEAERLEQAKNEDSNGPLLPDGTPLSRMDELTTAVLVVSATGEIQMANKQAHHMFGYKKGDLDGKSMAALLAPQSSRRLTSCLAAMVERSMEGQLGRRASATAGAPGGTTASDAAAALNDASTAAVLGMHRERMAFPMRVSLTKASGAGEDSTFIALLEPVSTSNDTSFFWVAPNGIVAACDPQFIANFGYQATDVSGAHLESFLSCGSASTSTLPGGGAAGGGAAGKGGSAVLHSMLSGVSVDAWDSEPVGGDLLGGGGAGRGAGNAHVLDRLLALTAVDSVSKGGPQGAMCLVSHRYSTPVPCMASIRHLDLGDAPLFEIKIRRASPDPFLMLVTDRKGAIKFSTPQLAAVLTARDHTVAGGLFAEGGMCLTSHGDHHKAGSHHLGANHHAAAAGGHHAMGSAQGLITGYTLQDFLPSPWKEMHGKLLKDLSTTTTAGRAQWSCRQQAGSGPSLQLHNTHGQSLYMHVNVSSSDSLGELQHIVRFVRSSLEGALSERRLRLSVNSEGRITAVSQEVRHMFGFDSKQMVGRLLWEVVDGLDHQMLLRLPSTARQHSAHRDNATFFASLLERVLHLPAGRSWRVAVAPPLHATSRTGGVIDHANAELAAAQRASRTRAAVMQIHMPTLAAEDSDSEDAAAAGGVGATAVIGGAGVDSVPGMGPAGVSAAAAAAETVTLAAPPPAMFVDLWPTNSVSGVLELDPFGRITSVLEEHLRPAGLLFGVATASLLGEQLTHMLTLPAGRVDISDLLSASGRNKKSSMKQNQKEPTIKVGPLHVLQGMHSDGQPLEVEVQVVGKPGGGQPLTALLRLHAKPLTPAPIATPPDMALVLPPPGAVRSLAPSMMPSMVASEAAATATFTATATERDRDRERPRTSSTDRAMAMVEEELSRKSAVMSPAPGTPLATAQRQALAAHGPGSQGSTLTNAVAAAAAAAAVAAAAGVGPGRSGSGVEPPMPPGVVSGSPRGSATVVPSTSLAKREGSVTSPPPPQPPAAPTAMTASSPSHWKATAVIRVGDSDDDASDKDSGEAEERGGGGEGGGMQQMPSSAPKSMQRVSDWVESKGALFQNSVSVNPGGGGGGGLGGALRSEGALGSKSDNEDEEDRGSEDDLVVVPRGPSKAVLSSNMASGIKSGGMGGGMGGGGYPGLAANNNWTTRERASLRPEPTAGNTGGGYMPAQEEPRAQQQQLLEANLPRGGGGGGGGGGGEAGGGADFDDAASNGGQSAISGQSGASSSWGNEYKRGKRFRNLVKLMDSSQAAQVLQRFKRGALLTMIVLAVAHTICFGLIVSSIKEQQQSMASLVEAGRCQRMLHQVLVATRALDLIYKGRAPSNLYSMNDTETFAENIMTFAAGVKECNNQVAASNLKQQIIQDIYYYTQMTVWTANSNGTDVYTNTTLWDMATKVYMASKDVYQNYEGWAEAGVNISSTSSGQFLLKSGPDLFNGFRNVLDALLQIAVHNTHTVNNLQLACLAAEGCGVSVMAAALLAFLLRKMAVQRFTLYGTFLSIPVGLTRALAQQLTNTPLLEEEEDDDDEDGMDEGAEGDRGHGHGMHGGGDTGGGGDASLKQRRHATLEPSSSEPRGGGGGGMLLSQSQLPFVGSPGPHGGGRPPHPHMSHNESTNMSQSNFTLGSGLGGVGGGLRSPPVAAGGLRPLRWWSGVWSRMMSCMPCVRRRTHVLPWGGAEMLSPSVGRSTSMGGGGGHSSSHPSHHKRVLKADSNDNLKLLLPFVMWSCLVVIFYAVAVVELQGVSPLVAVASVSNFNTARTYRACFFAQELAAEEDVSKLAARRATLLKVGTMLKDAFYTLQLGKEAWRALGNATEQFPLVTKGLSYETTAMQRLFYSNTGCLRQVPNLPCPGPSYRFYEVTHAGLDSIMQNYLSHVMGMAHEVYDTRLGLANPRLDFIYNVGTKDLTDANVQVGQLHFEHIRALFSQILLLHIILFVLLWFFLVGFLGLLLNPLITRFMREKRRIAELMSQLPLELDVEKLVKAALGASNGEAGGAAGAAGGAAGASAPNGSVSPGPDGSMHPGLPPGAEHQSHADAARAWKMVLRSASATVAQSKERRTSALGLAAAPSMMQGERRASMMGLPATGSVVAR
ncbi:hypothetical protein Agub_g6134 [Astrephomene gubernaculifera]|uniref:PAS domain-containing protein n=1 Tax=Astrephomene gubernaculifera TaxID=47775 RepID=A0AAD3DPC9_9CHLO|nr:hypothetical protein Agub_g6134 [Astrephomene gubernaculifera]